MLSWLEKRLSEAANDPDNLLKWVLIYFGVSSLAFIAVWLIGYARSTIQEQD